MRIDASCGARIIAAAILLPASLFPSPDGTGSDFKAASIASIATGRFENQRVTLTGTVRDFAVQALSGNPAGGVLKLTVVSDGKSVDVLAHHFAGLDLRRIVESKVEVRGLSGAYRNRRGQFLSAVVTADRDRDIRILRAGPVDPFQAPLQSIGTLLNSTSQDGGEHRKRTQGVVTYYAPGHDLYLQSGDDAILVQTLPGAKIRIGDPLEVVGFQEAGKASPYLTNGIVRPAKEPVPPPRILRTSFTHAIDAELDARLIQIDGTVFDVVQRASELLIVLECDNPPRNGGASGAMIGAYLPGAIAGRKLNAEVGAYVELTGVSSLIVGEDHKPKSFSLTLRSPRDYRIIKGAPWWNTRRALTLFGAAGSFFLLTVVWVISLRKQVGAQTQLIRATLESTADAILVIDDSNRYVNANKKFTALFGSQDNHRDAERVESVLEYLGRQLLNADPLRNLLTSPGDGEAGQGRTILLRQNGSVVECDYERIPGSSQARAVLSFRDITIRQKSEKLERERNQVLEAITREDPLEGILLRICRLVENQDSRIQCTIQVINVDRAGRGSPASYLDTALTHTEFNASMHRDTSAPVIASVPLMSSGNTNLGCLRIASVLAVSMTEHLQQILAATSQLASIAIEHRRLFDQLDYLAFHDSLTGLLNRRALDAELQRTIETSQATNSTFGLLCIDLDRFKQINDTLSHRTGDLLICAVAQRLSQMATLRGAAVFRIGGDEFMILLTPGSTLRHTEELAQYVLADLKNTFQIGGRALHTTASIGLGMYPEHGTTTAAIQQAADSAMYKAKLNGKDQYKLFLTEWRVQEDGSFEMEAILREALESSWFEMHYQPKVSKSRHISGLEALIRLRHPQAGLIAPDRFITIAEDSGLIVQVGAWALNDVCRQIGIWRAKGISTGPVAVNVSATQFARGDFLTTVQEALERWHVPGHALELEVTESLLMNDISEAKDLMRELRALGINFAIDDFGTGYSSLAYLHALPVSILKIDRTFVRTLGSTECTALVTTIVQLARSLGLIVVAEGVETLDQFRLLQKLGCDQYQGFYFCQPKPAEQIEAFVIRNEALCAAVMRDAVGEPLQMVP